MTLKELKQIIEEKETVLVDFYADWCIPCKKQKPILKKLEKVFPNIHFIYKNVDTDAETLDEYNILSIPSISIFKKGVLKITISGLKSKKILKDIIKEYE